MGFTKKEKEALVNFFKALVAKDEAEEPIRKGKEHYSHRCRFDAANGALVEAARKAAETFEE